MNKYELTLVLDGKTSPAKRKALEETMDKIITILKGKIGKVEDWGEKELAGKIGKNTSGYYLHFPLELENASVKALNLKLKMEKDILRHLLVRKE